MTMDKVLQTFRFYYRNLESGCFDEPETETWNTLARGLKTKTEELKGDPWIYGKTPAFTQDLSPLSPPISEGWNLRVEKGVMTEAPACLESLIGLSYGRGISAKMLREKLPESLISGTIGDEFLSRLLTLIA